MGCFDTYQLFCFCFFRSLRYAALTSWWSIISHVVHHLGGNKISHELKTRPWNSFRVSKTSEREGGCGSISSDQLISLFFIALLCAEYIEEIKSGEEKFESLASQFSDCSSAKNGGDLGLFGRGTYSYTQWICTQTTILKYTRASILLFMITQTYEGVVCYMCAHVLYVLIHCFFVSVFTRTMQINIVAWEHKFQFYVFANLLPQYLDML